MTTEQDTASEEPTAADSEERWRPTRRSRIAALVLSILLVAGITGGIIVMKHNESAPLDAVRAYVDAIARGDASAANAMVDPERLKEDVDPALLTDKVLGSAEERITIKDVRLDVDADPTADVVEVEVNYILGEYEETKRLRAERTVATLGVLDNWRVIDPLLVPVQLETNLPSFDTASLGGTATVPVGGEADAGWPERRFFVYPGVYDLSGHESRYLTFQAEDVVTHTDLNLRPPTVHYEVTPELGNEVFKRLTKYLNDCVAAAPKVPDDCPWVIDAYADFATDIKLDGEPTVDYIGENQVENRSDGKTEPPMRFSGNGFISYINEEGEWKRDPVNAYGLIAVTPDDDLTVTFTSDPLVS